LGSGDRNVPTIFFRKENKMTRKHFIALAKVCIKNKLDDASVHDIALVCKNFNKNFSYIKFLDYVKEKGKENV